MLTIAGIEIKMVILLKLILIGFSTDFGTQLMIPQLMFDVSH
jgi:hypothetical protein